MMKIEVARLLGAVTREATTRELDGKPAVAVVASRTYDTTPEDLWDAVTNPERIPRWFSPVSGDLKLGGRYQIEGNASGTITRCKPPEELALTWEWAGSTSWVELRLAAAPRGRTVLRLEHLYHPWEQFEKQYGPGAGGVGWEISLAGLYLHLTSPDEAPKPSELESAWLKTEDGKAFLRGASEGWGAAAIQAGTPEVAAREAAQRTEQFYVQRAGA
jgi:uncharacterized protein YndB with AHSA1/START domain